MDGYYARVLFDFSTSERGEISLRCGEIVFVTHQVDANWLYVDFRWMATMRECCLTSAPVSGVRSACAAGRSSSSLTRWMRTGSVDRSSAGSETSPRTLWKRSTSPRYKMDRRCLWQLRISPLRPTETWISGKVSIPQYLLNPYDAGGKFCQYKMMQKY